MAKISKSIKQDQLRNTENKKYKTLIKNSVKRFREQIVKKEGGEKLKFLISQTQKVLDKAVNKNIIHKNKAARIKSKFHRQASKILSE